MTYNQSQKSLNVESPCWLPPAVPSTGSKAASAALLHSLYKIVSMALALPLALPTARQQLETVLPLALRHVNGLNHVADALLLGQQVRAALVPSLPETSPSRRCLWLCWWGVGARVWQCPQGMVVATRASAV